MSFYLMPEEGRKAPPFADLALLVIRLLTVAAFFYYQLVGQIHSGFHHLWNRREWDLADQFQERGLPQAGLLAVLAVLAAAAAALGIAFGFLTRLNGFLLMALAGWALFSTIPLSPALNPQATVLYLGVFAGFACGGAGRFSLDYLLAGRRAGKLGP